MRVSVKFTLKLTKTEKSKSKTQCVAYHLRSNSRECSRSSLQKKNKNKISKGNSLKLLIHRNLYVYSHSILTLASRSILKFDFAFLALRQQSKNTFLFSLLSKNNEKQKNENLMRKFYWFQWMNIFFFFFYVVYYIWIDSTKINY